MRLGEILIQKHLITGEDLDRALELQRERGDKLGKILVDLGFVAARDVLIALSEQLQVPLLVIEGPPAVSPETEALSPKFLRQFRCLPMRLHDHTVTLAMADPLDESCAPGRDRIGKPASRADRVHALHSAGSCRRVLRTRHAAGRRRRDRAMRRRARLCSCRCGEPRAGSMGLR
jgi:hypothetical protein